MNEPRDKMRSKSVIVMVVLITALAYPMSYAPVVRMLKVEVKDPDGTIWTKWDSGKTLPVYKPIDWLIYNTPLRKPFLWWAGLWGVRDEFKWNIIINDAFP